MPGEYYDREGDVIDLEQWAKLLEQDHYKRVAYTEVDTAGDTYVSTVWLGINHRFLDGGEPVIFETMIFGGEHDQDMRRYSNEEDALEGHEEMVAIAKAPSE